MTQILSSQFLLGTSAAPLFARPPAGHLRARLSRARLRAPRDEVLPPTLQNTNPHSRSKEQPQPSHTSHDGDDRVSIGHPPEQLEELERTSHIHLGRTSRFMSGFKKLVMQSTWSSSLSPSCLPLRSAWW